MKIGNKDIVAMKLGTRDITKMYLGKQELSGGGPTPPALCPNEGTLVGAGVIWEADIDATIAANVNSVRFVGDGTGKIVPTTPMIVGVTGSVSIFFKKEPAVNNNVLLSTHVGTGAGYLQVKNDAVNLSSDDGSALANFTGVTINDDTWYNLIVTKEPAGAKAYLDGIQFGGVQAMNAINTFTQMGVYFNNQDGNVGFGWKGNLAEFRLWSSALITAQDIANVSSGGEPETQSDVHWKINEGSGVIVSCYQN